MKNIAVVIFMLSLGLLTSSCVSVEVPKTDTGPLKAIQTAPEFDLDRISGGKLKSADLKGKVVVVDFWATWCEPCKEEVPQYNTLAADMEGKDVMILGLTLESGDLAEIKEQVGKLGIQYPTVVGDDATAEGFGGYTGLPTTYIVGRDWKIYKKYLGSWPPDKHDQIKKDIAGLLAQDLPVSAK